MGYNLGYSPTIIKLARNWARQYFHSDLVDAEQTEVIPHRLAFETESMTVQACIGGVLIGFPMLYRLQTLNGRVVWHNETMPHLEDLVINADT